MLESDLQREVIAQAKSLGLLVFHSGDSRKDIGKGFPDLCLVGPGGVAFIELKSSSGQLTGDQTIWRHRLLYAGAEYRLYGPSELISGEIGDFLTNLSTEPPLPVWIDSDALVA